MICSTAKMPSGYHITTNFNTSNCEFFSYSVFNMIH